MLRTRRARGSALAVALCVPLSALGSPARAEGTDGAAPASAAVSVVDQDPSPDPAQVPYTVPRRTLIPGTPDMPGGFHLMVNGFAQAQNAGIPNHTIANAGVRTWNAGATYPLLQDDWAMVYGRDEHGWVEGLLMLDFEPFTVGPAGVPEIGQSGEGLWDAQHAHQFIHQAMVAFHPLAGIDGWHPEGMMKEGNYDLAVFGGQGSATIGPPIFMHRASDPGPTVPRKHHKGENPHETFPVVGTSLRIKDTWLETSVFSALELTPEDSRFYPHLGTVDSVAARVRHVFGRWLEVQVSGERLRDQGHGEPDAWQASASAYAWSELAGWRLDALLDWAIDAPDAAAGARCATATCTGTGILGSDRPTAEGALAELATRSPSRRQILWLRSEINQREESPALGSVVSSPWLFETLGFEQVVLGGKTSGLQMGLFGEGTFISIPSSLEGVYGTRTAVTLNVGVHVFGMWMLDGSFRRMSHGGM